MKIESFGIEATNDMVNLARWMGLAMAKIHYGIINQIISIIRSKMKFADWNKNFELDFLFGQNFPCIFAKYSLEGFSLKYGGFFHISVCILPSLIIIPIKMVNNTVMTMIFFLVNILIYLTTYLNLPIIPQTKNPTRRLFEPELLI